MVHLTGSDGDRLRDAATALSAADDYSGLPSRLFAAVAAIVDADLLSYNEVNLTTGEARFVLKAADDVGSPSRAAPFLRRFGYHPAALSAVAGSPDPVPRFVRDPRLRALGVGNCCGVAELRLNNGLSLSEDMSRLLGVGVSRAVRDFDVDDESALAAVHPLMIEAVRRATGPALGPLPDTAGSPAASRLTRREREVLYWVSMGKTNEEIAIILGARPLTVKKHLEHVYDKLEVPNRTAAAMAARGLTGQPELLLRG